MCRGKDYSVSKKMELSEEFSNLHSHKQKRKNSVQASSR